MPPIRTSHMSALEAKVDDLERRLVEKIEVTSGFGEAEDQARKMRLSLKFFDTTGNGLLSYDEFFAAMTKFNLVGVQREIEALFNRHDEYLSGFVDYQEFSLRLWGLSPNAITLDPSSRVVINKLKGVLVSMGGASGYHRLMQIVKRIDGAQSTGLTSREDLRYALSDFGMPGLSKPEWDTLFERFDVRSNGTVFIMEFMRYLRGGMPLGRKQLVLTVFQRLDHNDAGVLKVETIMQNLDFNSFSGAIEGGSDTAASEMLESFDQGGDLDGRVTWTEFLNFFAGVSLAIDDEDYFELVMRNAIKPSNGSPTRGRFAATYANARRVKVTFGDKSQQVVELTDEGVDEELFDEMAIIRRLAGQGIYGVVSVQIL